MITLWQAEVFHHPKDFGDQEADFIKRMTEEHSEPETKIQRAMIDEFWKKLEASIRRNGLYAMQNLHVFLDGLDMNTISVPEKVRDLAQKGVPMYRIAAELQTNGANVHRTEQHKLLDQAKQLQAKGGAKIYPMEAQKLLLERDTAIAKRITDVMPDESIGLLIVGREHDVVTHLGDNFLVTNFC